MFPSSSARRVQALIGVRDVGGSNDSTAGPQQLQISFLVTEIAFIRFEVCAAHSWLTRRGTFHRVKEHHLRGRQNVRGTDRVQFRGAFIRAALLDRADVSSEWGSSASLRTLIFWRTRPRPGSVETKENKSFKHAYSLALTWVTLSIVHRGCRFGVRRSMIRCRITVLLKRTHTVTQYGHSGIPGKLGAFRQPTGQHCETPPCSYCHDLS